MPQQCGNFKGSSNPTKSLLPRASIHRERTSANAPVDAVGEILKREPDMAIGPGFAKAACAGSCRTCTQMLTDSQKARNLLARMGWLDSEMWDDGMGARYGASGWKNVSGDSVGQRGGTPGWDNSVGHTWMEELDGTTGWDNGVGHSLGFVCASLSFSLACELFVAPSLA